MHCYDFYDSPHGRMLLVADDDGLSGVYFEGGDYLEIAEKFGALATLKKPFRPSDLVGLVARLLAERPDGAP